jgi:2-phosphosulfolactate phosphatase
MNPNSGLEVLFAPAEFNALANRDLSQSTCVVFDVLRATSSMITAFANGAARILPCCEIAEAIAAKKTNPALLLAGERNGLRITSAITGSIDFDLGNSPRELAKDKVCGRSLAMTTTNGTRALRACGKAKSVFISSFLNLAATAEAVRAEKPAHLLLVCSGTYELAAYEDTLAAGATCKLLSDLFLPDNLTDSSLMAKQIYQSSEPNLSAALKSSQNGRRLMSQPQLRDDVDFCAQRDVMNLVAKFGKDGCVEVQKSRLLQR